MFLAALAATGVVIAPASAQRGGLGSTWAQPEDRDKERDVPLSSVLRDLRAQFGGKHLDAQKVGSRYVIAWITGDGRRLTIEVDAATGRIISTR